MNAPLRIDQFHSGSSQGDAITGAMFCVQRWLRSAGAFSDIYVEHVGDGLKNRVKDCHASSGQPPADVLLVHHSMGHNAFDWVWEHPGKKVVVYHNITPPRFFNNNGIALYAELGSSQLQRMGKAGWHGVAVSTYNRGDLLAAGFERADVVPLLFDLDEMKSADFDAAIAETKGRALRFLFVGRVLPHKCQDELVELAAHLRNNADVPVELVLVGGLDDAEYVWRLRQLVRRLDLGSVVRILGKVSNRELHAWYRSSNGFICLSDHEGFGVPLIEAMLFNVPVFAYASSAIPETLGGAGVLLRDKNDLDSVAQVILEVCRDNRLRNCLLQAQRKRLEEFRPATIYGRLQQVLEQVTGTEIPPYPTAEGGTNRLRLQFEGPAETSYSLAIVNRNIACSLAQNARLDVSVHLTEGPGNYQPNLAALRRFPQLKELTEKGSPFAAPDILLRNLYPPRVWDMDGAFNALCFAWEESLVPHEWVQQFNRHLDCIFAASSFTKKALADSGVQVPIINYGHGAEHSLTNPEPIDLPPNPGFRFLHLSSCFPRKGIDVLVRVFTETFEPDDGVQLLIKTFSNPHHQMTEELSHLRTRKGNRPDVILLEGDMSPGQIASLYQESDCLAMPSRGEGFGLPVAEGFLAGKPAIVTGYGGLMDFCDSENSWLLPFRLRPAGSHLSEPGSLWAEPDATALSKAMVAAVQCTAPKRKAMGEAGRKRLADHFSWRRSASVITESVGALSQLNRREEKPARLAWISTWKVRCGIAAYSDFLLREEIMRSFHVQVFADYCQAERLSGMDDALRCWHQDFNRPKQEELIAAVLDYRPEVVVLQFNFGFFSVEALSGFLRAMKSNNIPVVIDFHSTKDVDKPDLKTSLRPITEDLAGCHRLIVHNLDDLDRLQDYGLLDVVTYLPHGMNPPGSTTDRDQLKAALGLDAGPVVASFGFLLPHKGIIELVEGFHRFRNLAPSAKLLLINARHPDPLSAACEAALTRRIVALGLEDTVARFHDFLPEQEIEFLLSAADIAVFPYLATQESASGAVRFALASDAAVVTTEGGIFRDLAGIVHQIPEARPQVLAEALRKLWSDPGYAREVRERQKRWMKATRWERTAGRLAGTFRDAIHANVVISEIVASPRC
ncbi:MAG: glycosyltransferase [Puniceicoccaceae bacterium]|nr:MAG: glycosyltransferase [Puniceicoccaceae bacterium]